MFWFDPKIRNGLEFSDGNPKEKPEQLSQLYEC